MNREQMAATIEAALDHSDCPWFDGNGEDTHKIAAFIADKLFASDTRKPDPDEEDNSAEPL